MAREARVIPDIYFVEGEGVEGQEEGRKGSTTEDLTKEGFIPIQKLKLEDLPEPIRTQQHLQLILDFSKNVVKITNNMLSDQRPEDDQFKQSKGKGICGSGFLVNLRSKGVFVTTNRHVLFNEEELRKSTFSIFSGSRRSETMLYKRSEPGNGKFFLGKYSVDDVAHAYYVVEDEMADLIKDNCPSTKELQRHLEYATHPGLGDDRNLKPIVCLISHPLGQRKHVSFGEMVDYNLESRTILHSAPSKPGSSGAPVIVFSKYHNVLAITTCHVSTDPETGLKTARVQFFEISAEDMYHSFCKSLTAERNEPNLFEMLKKAKASLESAALATALPVFGAFLVRAETANLPGLDWSTFKPCENPLTVDSKTSCDLKPSVKKVIDKIAQVAPSFILCPPDMLHKVSDLTTLLGSKGQCFCRSIVRMMERGRLEDGAATERYLTPQTAAAKMSSAIDVTMLWSNMSKPDFQVVKPEEGCLLNKCLELGDSSTIQVALLHMIVKANGYVQQLFSQADSGPSTSTPGEEEKGWGTLYSREKSERPSQQSQEEEYSTADKENALNRLVYDVLTVHHLGLVTASLTLAVRPANVDQTGRDPNSSLSRCLAVSEHALQHERQSHRDSHRPGQDAARCRCGRPGLRDVCVAHMSLTSLLEGRIHEASLCQTGGFLADSLTEMEACSVDLEAAIQTALNKAVNFSLIQKPVTLFLASGEAFLHNYCLLAGSISSLFQPRYCAFPVSVFGRPGSRPRHVTQPELQDTAWEPIRDAILASDFPPTDLSELEEDADRRQRLIDAFVDMKQLKREGRISPDLFEERLERSNMCLFDFSHGGYAYEDCTHFFVWNVAFLLCPRFVGSCSGSLHPRQKPLMNLVQRLFASGDDV